MKNLCIILGIFISIAIHESVALAQCNQTTYRDEYIYCFINNYKSSYVELGPKLPRYQLEIKNISSSPIKVKCMIRVVLRNSGGVLDYKIVEENVNIPAEGTRTVTSWMDTLNKNNAYYCVEGFDIISVTPIIKKNYNSLVTVPQSSQLTTPQPKVLEENEWEVNGPMGTIKLYTILKGKVYSEPERFKNGKIVKIFHWKTINGVKYGCTRITNSDGRYYYIKASNLIK